MNNSASEKSPTVVNPKDVRVSIARSKLQPHEEVKQSQPDQEFSDRQSIISEEHLDGFDEKFFKPRPRD